jgi:enterochelin esterase-like enzyme
VAAWIVLTGAVGGSVDRRGARVTELTIESRAVGRRLPVSVVEPRGANRGDRRPLLVFLHGRDADEHSFFSDQMFEALARLGPRAPIVAFPYGAITPTGMTATAPGGDS